jgi:hypothetical protein
MKPVLHIKLRDLSEPQWRMIEEEIFHRVERTCPRIQRILYEINTLFRRMKKKDEKMDESSLRRQLAGTC